jgi:tRNA pseudouridine55 synthase
LTTSGRDARAPRNADFNLRVVCSSGTYIRVLAEDIGKSLGLGAHLTRLRRTRAGQCDLSRAVTLERLSELAAMNMADQALIEMSEVLALPEVKLSSGDAAKVAHGNAIRSPGQRAAASRVMLLGESGQLIAVADYEAESQRFRPRVVLVGQ